MKTAKYIIRRCFAAFVLLLAACVALPAQVGQTYAERMDTARKLYQGGAFYAAEQAFEALAASADAGYALRRSEIEAYRILCAIALDRPNVKGHLKDFAEQYPTAPELPMVRFTLAGRYFDQGAYDEALAIYDCLSAKELYRAWRGEFTFKKSFCQMKATRYDEAAAGFGKLSSGRHNVYKYPSLYYLGYVNYLQKHFELAYTQFVQSAADSRFRLMSQYYQVECRFMLKDYPYVTANGPGLLDTLEADLQSNMLRMISESYYGAGDAESARRYMEMYMGSGTEVTRKDHYLSGIIAYNLQAWDDAVAEFGYVTRLKDTLAQNAFYYIGDAQLLSGNKIAAIGSFRSAAEAGFDPVITEDAFFNYAKLSFDVNGDIAPFRQYMQDYPLSGRDDEINRYIAAAFILDKDYGQAIEALQRISKPLDEDYANLRKAALYRALVLIAGGSYRSASDVLDLALDLPSDNEALTGVLMYWRAECDYRAENYSDAFYAFKSLLSREGFNRTDEYPSTLYNMAYCCFNLGQTGEARRYFDQYLTTDDDLYFGFDARVRTADTYFLENNYTAAAAEYEMAWRIRPQDLYPGYQAAVAYALAGDEAKQISILQEVVSTQSDTELYYRAYFDLGRAYMQAGRNAEAEEIFLSLAQRQDGMFYLRSLLQLAMICANEGKTEQAIAYYKRIVEEQPGSHEAGDALSGLESIYRQRNQPEIFLAYLEESGMTAARSDAQKEEMLYKGAIRLYHNGQYSSAVGAFQRFIAAYPSSSRRSEARLHMAESMEAVGRRENALDNYKAVYEDVSASSGIAALAALEYADLAMKLGRYKIAADAYAMETGSPAQEYALRACMGLTNALYADKRYDEAIAASRRCASLPFLSATDLRPMRYVEAKCLLMNGEREAALPILKELSADVSDEYGAECAYLLISDSYNCGRYQDVATSVYSLSESTVIRQYWLAKSYIVLGDSFVAQGNKDQAKATFESILEGYKPEVRDEIAGQVKLRLSRLDSSK